jgi:hypothetical protein
MRNQLTVVAVAVWVAVGCQGAPEPPPEASSQEMTGTQDGLGLRVTPLSEIYRIEGSLEVQITLENRTDSVMRFRPIFNFGRWLDADIWNSSETLLESTASIDPPNAYPITLEPGQSITETVDLRCSLPVTGGVPCTAPYDLKQPGTYRIRMRFTMPCDIRGCEEVTTVEADAITIRVAG